MPRVKHMRVIALAVALVFLFSSVAFAAAPKYVYFQSGNEMVKVDYGKAVNDAMNNDNTLYNAVKQYVGEAEETGAPVIVETDDQKVLDYQKALGAGKRFTDIVNDPAYQANKPDFQKELRVENGQAVIGDIRPEVVEISSITPTDTLGVVEIVAEGTTAEALQAAITPACTVVAKEGVPNTYTVTIQNAAYDQEITLQFAAGFQLKAGVNNKVKWASPQLGVESVSVINATTVEVQLKDAPASDLTDADAGKFTVLENGNPVAVSGVAKKAADLSGKTYRLTVASLNGKQGDLSVNGTAAAVPAGKVYAFDFKVPDVTSIVARGTKTLEVIFSEKMDSASVITGNFKVKKVVASVPPVEYTTQTAVLSADGRTVTITLDKDLLVADYVLVLGTDAAQVKDVAGNGIPAKTEMSFRPTAEQLADTTAPALTRATYNTVKGELTLIFNKNILDSTLDVTKLSINGYALTVNDVVNTGTVADDNVVVITLSAASKDAVNAMTGALTLTAAKDAYGDASKLTAGETFTIVREEPAVIKSASYNQETNLLTVTFDKPVTLEADTVASVGVDDTNKVNVTKAMAVESPTTTARATWTFDLGKDGNKAAATFEGYTDVANKGKIMIAANAVKNEAGVANVAGQDTYDKGVAIAYTADTTKPLLQAAEYNNNTKELKLTFSEKVVKANVDFTKIDIMKDATTAVAKLDNVNTGNIAEPDSATKTITVSLIDSLSGLANDIETSYNMREAMKVILDEGAVKDEANLVNAKVDYAAGIPLTFKDYVAPKIESVTAQNANLVEVTFSETVDRATAENVANYVIKDTTGATLAVTGAALQAMNPTDGTMAVLLTTATQTAGMQYTITVSNVKDSPGGNIIATTSRTFNGSSTQDAEKLTLDNLEVAAPANSRNDTLTLTFNVAPAPAAATNVSNYVVLQADSNDATGWANATSVSLTNAKAEMVPGNAKQVIITLDAPNLQNGKWYKVVASNLTTVTGKPLGTAEGDRDAVAQLTGVAAPTVTSITEYQTAAGAIKLVFSEELTGAGVAANYKVNDKAPVKATYTWDPDKKVATVVLDLSEALTQPIDVVLATDSSGNTNIKNLAGVPFASKTISKPASLSDNVAPQVDTVVAKTIPNAAPDGADVITVTFKDNDILAASAGENSKSNFVVYDPSGAAIDSGKYTVTFIDGGANADSVTIKFNGEGDKAYNLQYGASYSVKVTGVVDTSGNEIAATTRTATWDPASDKDGPMVAYFVYNSADGTFAVTFGEDVDPATAVVKSNYTIVNTDDANNVLTPIYVTFDAEKNMAIITVTGSITAGATYNVTIKNIKDLAGNVSDGTKPEHSKTCNIS